MFRKESINLKDSRLNSSQKEHKNFENFTIINVEKQKISEKSIESKTSNSLFKS
jgi:hypothetical protein